MSEPLPRDLVRAHLAGAPVPRLPAMPITMMFAARVAEVPYRRYCEDWRTLVDAQARVAERFRFDHVSCISDPTREAADLGATIAWFPDQPPAIVESDALLADASRLRTLRFPDPAGGGRMTDRLRAAEALRAGPGQERLVEGWVEGPCAEAADLRGINVLMTDFFDDPAFVEDLFAFCTDGAIRFARAQVDAGVDIVGVGDAAASLVGPAIYEEVVLPYERRLVDAIHAMGALVRLHVCGNTSRSVRAMAETGADVIDLDAPVDMASARAAAGPGPVLLGNLNPVTEVLHGSPAGIEAGLRERHDAAGARWIVGAGCELPRATPFEHVEAMTSYARSHRP